MMEAFLFVFDNSKISRELVIKRLDKIRAIQNWYAFFDNTFCLASNKDARTLSQLVRDALPEVRFVIVEVDPQKKGGWLPKSVWTFLSHPEPADAHNEDA
jgi:hypothetical protein